MARTRVKICGIGTLEDGLEAIDAGADALGFVFYAKSKRNIDIERCRAITSKLPPFIEKVGLFVDAEVTFVAQAVKEAGLSLLQFHGDETPEYCEQFSLPYIKAVRMKPGVDLHKIAQEFMSAQALLVDAYQPGIPGGTGQTFNWDVLPSALAKPIILAGGLTPQNVEQAITQVHPYAVDVSGGVESAPGSKSADLISKFMQGVFRSDAR
ncbi:phosphoribosylanthranilate isomerase [Pokkaliibacter sp. CJK22405]|uniref:phosphoribosylanthranilate isomerase n=1 Tax=Pokkaliibacter sp. CJK22405 TaxID=3384615 RepID=UPI003984E105